MTNGFDSNAAPAVQKKKRPFWHYISWGCGGCGGIFLLLIVIGGAYNWFIYTVTGESVGEQSESPVKQSGAVTEQTATTATASQKNAVRSAKDYLATAGFSRKGLIQQLEYEGFSASDAAYGADNAKADWTEQAVRSAKNYLDTAGFSRKGLIKQLEYEGFSASDATHGADNVKADWMEQAVRAAKNYLATAGFSRKGLIQQLEYEGFTNSEAKHGADGVGL